MYIDVDESIDGHVDYYRRPSPRLLTSSRG